MKNRHAILLILLPVCVFLWAFITYPKAWGTGAVNKADDAAEKGLFDSDEILQVTLKGNIRDLLNDRTDKATLFPVELSYKNEDSSDVFIPIMAKTRGHFRRMRGNCTYPPILLQFEKEGAHQQTIFREQQKLKLVMPCRGDQYVVREWLAYRMYNLVTPFSFRARLVKVKLEDERNKRSPEPFYGILLEEESQMAKRNNGAVVEDKLQPQQIEQEAFLKMAVFQYLIGNTDWSVQYLQNIKLVAVDEGSPIIAVPYDFDHSGLVNAPYAKPAEELLMSSTRERRYRGYCVQDLNVFNDVLAEYRRLKDDLYGLFTEEDLMDQKSVKSTLQWLDGFYATINNPKAWQKDLAYPCDKSGTGNVIIRGLKEEK